MAAAKAQILRQFDWWQMMIGYTERQIRDYQSFNTGLSFSRDLRRDVTRTYQQAKGNVPHTRAGKRLKRLFLEILQVLSNQILSVPKRDLVYDDLVRFKDQLVEAKRLITTN
ncbi:hypothetical protein [Secundilactobacillus kimchicus]|uniref:Uncharacterized protein n=1 Tax=Secundilactobacillus kimchicus JCM 15530 TaxID=1302272 RepID=A0A0R1HR80_9LACO|nr:hypothetical protein [Secundilactobacillus kimchicus]KRK49136.1 hypothetical protein FC96_GL000053 [Secundilactobacillus kimchicus JCM 15530]MBT9671382.1 hypothetical protein [Secundilactobacillus kimchicus]